MTQPFKQSNLTFMKSKSFVLHRKNYSSGLSDFNFAQKTTAGFCGRKFIEQFPFAKDRDVVTLVISTERNNPNEKEVTCKFDKYIPLIFVDGEMIQLCLSTKEFLMEKFELKAGVFKFFVYCH